MPSWTAAKGCDAGGANEAQTADQGGTGGVCGAKSNCGTGIRTDQTSPRISAIPIARVGKGSRRVGSGVPYAQHFEAVSPLHSIEMTKPSNRDCHKAMYRANSALKRPHDLVLESFSRAEPSTTESLGVRDSFKAKYFSDWLLVLLCHKGFCRYDRVSL